MNLFNTDITEHVKYILANARQVNAAFSTAREKIERQSFRLFYVPYEQLSPDIQNAYLQNITLLQKQLKSDECVNYTQHYESLLTIITNSFIICHLQIKLCHEWINLGLQGIEYYNTYYKYPLLFCVTFIGLGWIVLLIINTSYLKNIKKINKLHKLLINGSYLILMLFSFVFISGKYFSKFVL